MRWNKRLVLLKVSKYLIIICLILSIILALYTIYGHRVGNFVISVNDGGNSITLTESEEFLNDDFSFITPRLLADGVTDQKDCSYNNIPRDVDKGLGSSNDEDKKYFAYSFYLLNLSENAIDYEMSIVITDVSKNVDAAIRVMVIENYKSVRGLSIYAKQEASEEKTDELERRLYASGCHYYLAGYFEDNVVCKTLNEGFDGRGYKKYTVVIWLEGWDEDTNNSIVLGQIKMQMNFEAYR